MVYYSIKEMDRWSAACCLKEHLPELQNKSADDIKESLRNSRLMFFTKKAVPVPFLIRLTLPIAVIVTILMILFMPVKFIFTGVWGYKRNRITNWLNAVGF